MSFSEDYCENRMAFLTVGLDSPTLATVSLRSDLDTSVEPNLFPPAFLGLVHMYTGSVNKCVGLSSTHSPHRCFRSL